MWCGVVWCGVVWCGVVWCGVMWCGVVVQVVVKKKCFWFKKIEKSLVWLEVKTLGNGKGEMKRLL